MKQRTWKQPMAVRISDRRWDTMRLAIAGALAGLMLLMTPRVLEAVEIGRNFDARISEQRTAIAPSAAQLAALDALTAEVGEPIVSFDPATGVARSLFAATGYLTGAAGGADALDLALDYAHQSRDLLGVTAADLGELEIEDRVVSESSGADHIYLGQRYGGIPVYNGLLHVNVNRDGRILSLNNGLMPDLAAALNRTAPAIEAADAVLAAARHLGVDTGTLPEVEKRQGGPRRATLLELPGLSREPIEASLMILPIVRGDARLVWNFQLHLPGGDHVYDMTVDAESGKVWTRFDWVEADSYKVYPLPTESPNHRSPLPPSDGRVVVSNPAAPPASPYGWHDTNGAGGPEFTIMRGNNVHAYDDIDNNNAPPSSQPNCASGAKGDKGGKATSVNCIFPINLSAQPNNYTSAAVANLFYWNNIVHDVQYRYGFTEAAGNFQVNNYGRGGAAGDDVRAEAQDGGGINNANFLTEPDGTRPRMQMYLWNGGSPQRDGDLDAGIIVHEYGHGISKRLVGGPSNVGCLSNTQQPGEGLSDWWALAMTHRAGDTGAQGRGIGTYSKFQPTTGPGIRTQRYSTNQSINNWTYESINGMGIPHGVGSVWAQGAWEAYWALVDQHGFSTDFYNAGGGAGNQRMMLYVLEGLKNTPCSPTFTQVRDGIIQAATDNYGGGDVCRLWDAFAAFGLGSDAQSGGPNSLNAVNGFSVPASCDGDDDPPNASFTASCNGLTCTFNGSGSSDDNGIVSYSWNFGDGGSGTGVIRTHTYSGGGSYSVSLTVTDTIGQTDSTSQTVTISCGDTTRPNVSITSPTAGSFLWDIVPVQVQASDNVGVTSVQVRVDGSVKCTDSSPPWSCNINIDNFSSGPKTLTARAFDACGNNRTSAGVPVSFNNNPLPIIDAPLEGATVSGDNVRIHGWVSDSDGVASVSVMIDGQPIPTTYGLPRPDVCAVIPLTDPNCPNVGYEAFFDSTLLLNGGHSITLTAVDAVGETTANWPSPPRAFEVFNQPDPCTPGPNKLCLRGSRFMVEATFVNGTTQAAKARPQTDETGEFWFFNADNLEIGVKVLGPANGYWWVFHGGLTDLQYDLTVTDTMTGLVKTYNKPAGDYCGDADTTAFPENGATPIMADTMDFGAADFGTAGFALPDVESLFSPGGTEQRGGTAACTPSGDTLCLLNDRFEVRVLRSNVAQPAVPLTDWTGAVWFFNQENLETIVKVLDGRPFNNHFWVFYAGLSDRDYSVVVTDTVTGASKTYNNPLGNYCGVGDTSAFPG